MSSPSYEARSQAELQTAPKPFLSAFYTLGNVPPNQSIAALSTVVPSLKEEGPAWVGTGYCCFAYCLKNMGQYREAVAMAEQGRQFGLRLIGYWYYYDVVIESLNQLDDLSGALLAAESAIRFFHDEKSPGNEASHLGWKSNVLKQLAAHLSRQEESKTIARHCVIQAIEAVCNSLSITSEGLENIREEMEMMARIAARVGVGQEDLGFLKRMDPQLAAYVGQYFQRR